MKQIEAIERLARFYELAGAEDAELMAHQEYFRALAQIVAAHRVGASLAVADLHAIIERLEV